MGLGFFLSTKTQSVLLVAAGK
jgi:hypothetical protein